MFWVDALSVSYIGRFVSFSGFHLFQMEWNGRFLHQCSGKEWHLLFLPCGYGFQEKIIAPNDAFRLIILAKYLILLLGLKIIEKDNFVWGFWKLANLIISFSTSRFLPTFIVFSLNYLRWHRWTKWEWSFNFTFVNLNSGVRFIFSCDR